MKLTEEQWIGIVCLLLGSALFSGGCLSIHYREFINSSLVYITCGWVLSLLGLALVLRPRD